MKSEGPPVVEPKFWVLSLLDENQVNTYVCTLEHLFWTPWYKLKCPNLRGVLISEGKVLEVQRCHFRGLE